MCNIAQLHVWEMIYRDFANNTEQEPTAPETTA